MEWTKSTDVASVKIKPSTERDQRCVKNCSQISLIENFSQILFNEAYLCPGKVCHAVSFHISSAVVSRHASCVRGLPLFLIFFTTLWNFVTGHLMSTRPICFVVYCSWLHHELANLARCHLCRFVGHVRQRFNWEMYKETGWKLLTMCDAVDRRSQQSYGLN